MRLALLLLLSACTTGHATPQAKGQPTAQMADGFWDHWGDGKAELAGYALTMPRYGVLRKGEAVLVTVTEDFDTAQGVKSDRSGEPVVKLNEVRDFQTGIYDYNGMTSVFLPVTGQAPLGQPVKVSFSLQEWCGHVYEQLVFDKQGYARTLHSYFDGEADQATRLTRPAGGVVEEAMPVLVRGLLGELVAPGASREVPWLPSRLQDRLTHVPAAWTTAMVSSSAETQTVEVPAGSFEVRTYTAQTPRRTLQWQVHVLPPHRLVRWAHSDGEQGELTGVSREPYWQQSGEGKEALRGRLGLPHGVPE